MLEKMRTSACTDSDLVHVRPGVEAKEGGREGGRKGEGEGKAVEEGGEVEEHLTGVHEKGGGVVPLVAWREGGTEGGREG